MFQIVICYANSTEKLCTKDSFKLKCNSMPLGARRAYYGKVRISFSAA